MFFSDDYWLPSLGAYLLHCIVKQTVEERAVEGIPLVYKSRSKSSLSASLLPVSESLNSSRLDRLQHDNLRLSSSASLQCSNSSLWCSSSIRDGNRLSHPLHLENGWSEKDKETVIRHYLWHLFSYFSRSSVADEIGDKKTWDVAVEKIISTEGNATFSWKLKFQFKARDSPEMPLFLLMGCQLPVTIKCPITNIAGQWFVWKWKRRCHRIRRWHFENAGFSWAINSREIKSNHSEDGSPKRKKDDDPREP